MSHQFGMQAISAAVFHDAADHFAGLDEIQIAADNRGVHQVPRSGSFFHEQIPFWRMLFRKVAGISFPFLYNFK